MPIVLLPPDLHVEIIVTVLTQVFTLIAYDAASSNT